MDKRCQPARDWEKAMDIRYGLISADSQVVTDKNGFVERMSRSKWGSRVPQIIEATPNRKIES
ncbi:MAG TPA: hypothetical protein VLJ79_04700 [Candidatus Binatia bacterium]|nr:hypothetical protein [Candidatus Binatia bacterium]